VQDTAADPADALRLDRQLCFPLYAASNMITKLYRPLLAQLELTYPQYLVMLALWERAPRSVGALGDILHLDSGTLTPMLKRMEQAGLVARRRDKTDERRVLVHLTEAGAALRDQALRVPHQLAACIALPHAELADLHHSLGRLIEALGPSTQED
jgi:DNA-binding MarR family transcriptional regulator